MNVISYFEDLSNKIAYEYNSEIDKSHQSVNSNNINHRSSLIHKYTQDHPSRHHDLMAADTSGYNSPLHIDDYYSYDSANETGHGILQGNYYNNFH